MGRLLGRKLGLVFIWASAVLAMVVLYIQWPVAVYLMGVADWVWEVVIESLPIAQGWIDLHDTWVARFQMIFGFMALGTFISIIIWLLVNSARKEPVEIEY